MIQARLPTPHSHLFICPHCHDVWARVEGDEEWFQHHAVPCVRHPTAAFAYGCTIAGSLSEVEGLVDKLTPYLLKREFILALRHP